MFEIFVAVVVFGLLIIIAIFAGNCIEERKKGKIMGEVGNHKLVVQRINNEIYSSRKRTEQIEQFVTKTKCYEKEMQNEIEALINKLSHDKKETVDTIEQYKV